MFYEAKIRYLKLTFLTEYSSWWSQNQIIQIDFKNKFDSMWYTFQTHPNLKLAILIVKWWQT